MTWIAKHRCHLDFPNFSTRQFWRKFLGYALGRSVQLSDKPLLETVLARLGKNDHRVSTVIEWVVRSPQFREVRGRDYKVD